LSRNAAEFLRRGVRLLQMELEGNLEQCVPETVALENLEVGRQLFHRSADAECVPVWLTSMTPVWLDLTADGTRYLVFLRSVIVEGSGFCTLQGLLIDWDRLKEMLEAEVRDLFPNVRLVPIETSTPVTPGTAHSIMQTIPISLEAGEPAAAAAKPGLSASFKLGLAVAWTTTVAALIAIAYGVMKYVLIVERRMRFVAAVTHELRTPLTTFQLYTDLLSDGAHADEQERRGQVAMLQRESRRLARLVENVLAYARIEESRPSLNLSETTPAAILERVREGLADICSSSGKTLVIEDRCRDNRDLRTDQEVVTQILTNLVENACKYSAGAADPRIWLTASDAPDDALLFGVDDAGPGVNHHDRRRVFEPFQRGQPGSDAALGAMGLGLGLALSRYWATCLGGQLSLRRSPRPPNRYACFELRLPASPAP
jgi:signal transduction histidine kinase